MKVSALYTTVSVTDMDKAVAYFRDEIGTTTKRDTLLEGPSVDNVLGLKDVGARCVDVRLSEGADIRLVQHLAHKGRPIDPPLRQFDISFIHLDLVCKGVDQIYADFQKRGTTLHCPIQSENHFRFRDFSWDGVDGLRLETHEFSGKHSWLPDATIQKGFYAFAHTSLSVGNLDKTLNLYRDILGLKLIRQSHLEGPGFDLMDSLQGGVAENRVVRGDEGSELQFIWHYAGTHAGKGRPIGATRRQCDIGIVNVGLKTDDIEGLHKLLKSEGVTVNCDIQVGPDKSRSFSFKDPDGNLLIAYA